LSDDNAKLDKTREDATEFKQDTAMHTVPSDSTLRVKYLSEVTLIQQKWARMDKIIQRSLIKIGLLQNRVTSIDLLMLDVNDRIDQKIHEFTVRSLTNEYGFIWERNKQNITSFDSVTTKTARLNFKLLRYFFDPATVRRVNVISHIATLILFIAFLSWIYTSRYKLVRLKPGYPSILNQTNYIVKHSIVSPLAVCTILALYFYQQPPVAFLEILLFVIMGCIGILIKSVWPKQFFKFWGAIFVLMIFYAITNLFIQVSYPDRLLLLFLSIASIALGIYFLQESKSDPGNYPPHIRSIIKLFILVQGVSLLLNIIGRYSIAKIIGTTAVFNLCLGFGFYLMIQILMECLFLQLEANKSINANVGSYSDFKILQNKFKNVLVKIAIILWTINLIGNLCIKEYIYENIGNFLTHSYKFGTGTFTFGSIVIFIFVLWLSMIIARVINYFYDFAEQQSSEASDIRKAKTSVLLIRISVFTGGFIAAILFSGIPVTEVTIVLGALGVGIGFGLQNIVNNLVSGIILAFERPVQVGDIIEVGDRAGTIKEIGIRASKIQSVDGSELIIPNGDLISQHVINWTLSDNFRRIELTVGVAYGSDIEKVQAILTRIVKNRSEITQKLLPMVHLHNFSESSVDFKLLFWSAASIDKAMTLKSSVMSEVYNEFAKEGIEIPHPKRDIKVFFPGGTNVETNDLAAIKEIFQKKNTPTENPSDQAL